MLGLVILMYGLFQRAPYWVVAGCILLPLGGIFLGATILGTETTMAYRRSMNQMHSGKFDRRLQEHYAKKMYCVRVGVVRAARDLGLEDQLLPKLRNNRRPW